MRRRNGIVAAALVACTRFYQRHLSILLPDVCRFRPSCSQYAIEALRRHGAVRGIAFTAWRIVRCQPFCQGGEDPVP